PGGGLRQVHLRLPAGPRHDHGRVARAVQPGGQAVREDRGGPAAVPRAVPGHVERRDPRVDPAVRRRGHSGVQLMTGLRIGLADLIAPGDLLVAGQVLGEPTALLEEIFAADGLDGCRLFTGMSLTDVLERAPAGLGLLGFVGLGSAGRLLAAGRLDLVPCHMSDLPWAMTHGPLRPDVALVLVSPPDSQGMCSLGVEADYVWAAVNSARTVIAEVNSNVPRVAGDTCIPFDRIDAHLPTERPLPRYERPRPSGSERLIGARVAEFVR